MLQLTYMQPVDTTGPRFRKLSRLVQYEKMRFILVGLINTTVDFVVLFVLVGLVGVPTFLANIISTTVALIISYSLNKKAVFGDTDGHNVHQVILFIMVTVVGLWLLQGLLITLIAPNLHPLLGKNLALLVAKLVATVFSLTWNYMWYSRVVFRRQKS